MRFHFASAGEDSRQCPICARSSPRTLEATDLFEHTTPSQFSYYRCGACRLYFLRPIPADLSRFYPQSYAAYDAPTEADVRRVAVGQRGRIDFVARFRKGGELCDVGAAIGAFAVLARDRGFSVTCIEMDARCCGLLRRQGFSVVETSEVPLMFPQTNGYDVITMWHSLEHVPDPITLLDAASRALRSGGILVISTPNADAWSFRTLCTRWRLLDCPRHLHLFSLESLERLLTTRGFRLIAEEFADELGRALNLGGWQQSLMGASRTPITRTVARFAGRGIHFALRPLEERGRRGAGFTAIFEKLPA